MSLGESPISDLIFENHTDLFIMSESQLSENHYEEKN